MSVHDIYGCSSLSLEECGKLVEEIFNIELLPYSSDHYGEYLQNFLPSGEEVRILLNKIGDDWQEDELQEYGVLIKISDLKDLDRAAEVANILRASFDLVMRSEVMPREWAKRYKFSEGLPVLVQDVLLQTK